MKHLSFWIDTLASSKGMKETSPLHLILQMTVLKETSARKYPRDSRGYLLCYQRICCLDCFNEVFLVDAGALWDYLFIPRGHVEAHNFDLKQNLWTSPREKLNPKFHHPWTDYHDE